MGVETRIAGLEACWLAIVPERLGLWVPRRADDALDALDPAELDEAEERIPYFASLWPAGEALARYALDRGPELAGRRVLDLGCGIGVVGLAAAVAGARVTFLDWEPRSLDFVRASARRLGLEPEVLLALDWREARGLGHFDRILAADVLYEARNVAPIAAFLEAHLAPGGEAWIADPRRPIAEALPQAIGAAGLRLCSSEPLPYRPRDVRVDLHRVAPGGDPR